MQPERPEYYQILDSLVNKSHPDKRDWPAIFAILDSMQGAISINEYYYINGIGHLDTLLIFAIEERNILVTKTLIEKYGANPNMPEKDSYNIGYTPLMSAIIRKDLAMVKLLLYYGADPYKTCNYTTIFRRNMPVGQEPRDSFYIAEKLGNPAILKELNQFKK